MGSEKDYPDLWLKPPDAAYRPLLGPFPLSQHKIGPWQPIADWLKARVPSPGGQPPVAEDGKELLR